MATMFFGSQRAEQIFTTGPENLVANSTIILAGHVSSVSKKIVSTTEPPGPDASPLKWIITGEIHNPTALKGSAGGPVKFSRPEQDLALPSPRDRDLWEDDYSYFHDGDSIVLFGRSDHFPTKVLPSGSGQRDLVSLVRDIIAIEAGTKGEPGQAWLSYLNNAPTEQGRKSALRVLVQMTIGWKELAAALDRLLSTASLTDDMRAFSFGIVVNGLTQHRWKSDQVSVADFLARRFEAEQNPKLLLRYILFLKVLLNYSMDQAEKEDREPIRKRIINSLKRREATVSMIPELAEQYRQIRAAYPDML